MEKDWAATPSKTDVVSVLMATAATFSIAGGLWKLYLAANQVLSKLDTRGKTDEEILELLQRQLYDDYLRNASDNSDKVQAIIRVLIAAALKRSAASPPKRSWSLFRRSAST